MEKLKTCWLKDCTKCPYPDCIADESYKEAYIRYELNYINRIGRDEYNRRMAEWHRRQRERNREEYNRKMAAYHRKKYREKKGLKDSD